jgi:AAA+ superfamily predicted ATPase
MSHTAAFSADWQVANQRALSAALEIVRLQLQAAAAQTTEGTAAPRLEPPAQQAAKQIYADIARAVSPPPALESLSAKLRLSSFEQSILLLCAGMELDSAFANACFGVQGSRQMNFATFGLALALFPNAHWSALAPDAPLRYWRLIEFASGGSPSAPVTSRPLRIDERIMNHLAGVPHLDERLAATARTVDPPSELTPSHQQICTRIVDGWERTPRAGDLAMVLLFGADAETGLAIAAQACASSGCDLLSISTDAIPLNPGERNSFIRLWEREAILSRRALLLDHDHCSHSDQAHESAIHDFIQRANVPLIVTSRDRPYIKSRSRMEFEVSHPAANEQAAFWRQALGGLAQTLDGGLDRLTAQFSLSTGSILSAATGVRGNENRPLVDCLWDECRIQSRARMNDLAQRIESSAGWDDLVLPEAQKSVLHEIVAHVRHRAKVYDSWGFSRTGNRGLGISALFAGTSGTGKTMAAEVLAQELHLDLYRIDLSSVVSKYIGETEKNLRRLFDAAEEGGAILFFDEADALFGKRSEVKDSHDRYANIEVSYLLQRMECYRGLAILTTNFRSALDQAFLRRIRFVVQFPFPDAQQRKEIWRRIFPSGTPTNSLQLDRLAQLNVAGGNIRNIAINSAFLAANENEPVGMLHVLRAARSEYAKVEKTLTEAEISGWQ